MFDERSDQDEAYSDRRPELKSGDDANISRQTGVAINEEMHYPSVLGIEQPGETETCIFSGGLGPTLTPSRAFTSFDRAANALK